MSRAVFKMMREAVTLGEVLKESRRTIYSKPPRHPIGAAQSFFVMMVFAAAMLTPAAWILHHLPEYRQRAQQRPRT
ncbi:hypothetical protein FQA47_002400 [Oryzias melastigma]|uniref:Uncharacterized protein n=1 Tax=Oryzias melastigma TaxID=30732 RepID=A0A834FKF6_ORYME|nr:hypothetical protein FQA47_002400 [Oryzias melastigma]